MISVIALNEKFKPISPNDLIDKILETKYVRGIEMCVDPDDKEMVDYTDILVEACRDNNLLFQIHGDSSMDIEKQKSFMDKLSTYYDMLGYPINVVMHSLTRETPEKEIHDTQEYLKELLEYVDLNKIRISVENLNDSDFHNRLDKTEFIPVMYNDERLYMTYDIGHDIADYGKITDLDPLLLNRISNVHLHATTNKYEDGFDHKPIDDQNQDQFEQVLKGILYLKNNNYTGPVVFEYDLYLCDGDTIEDKLNSFLYSIDDTSEHII